MAKQPVNVVISGAAGQIGYALIPLFATGLALGPDQPMNLRLLDIPFMLPKLNGVVMEIEDGAYPLVYGIEPTADYEQAMNDVDYCVLVGGFPRRAGMDRAALVGKNTPIFKQAGEYLRLYAKPTTKVLVVANPANTNCWLAAKFAQPTVPLENFCALTRLDQNRAQAQVAGKLGVTVAQVKNVIIWGNHSKQQVPDVQDAKVMEEGKEEAVLEKLNNEDGQTWLNEQFVPTVQMRGKAIIEARGASSAMSAANAVKDCIRDWVYGTAPGQHVAMAVYNNETAKLTGATADSPNDMFFSFPCTCENGTYAKIESFPIPDVSGSLAELAGEQAAALGILGLSPDELAGLAGMDNDAYVAVMRKIDVTLAEAGLAEAQAGLEAAQSADPADEEAVAKAQQRVDGAAARLEAAKQAAA